MRRNSTRRSRSCVAASRSAVRRPATVIARSAMLVRKGYDLDLAFDSLRRYAGVDERLD